MENPILKSHLCYNLKQWPHHHKPPFTSSLPFSFLQDRVLRSGTTTASYFGSMHLEATKILSNIVLEKGQRAFVGKVNMMVNCPEDYRELSVDESAKETEDFILYVKSLNVRFL